MGKRARRGLNARLKAVSDEDLKGFIASLESDDPQAKIAAGHLGGRVRKQQIEAGDDPVKAHWIEPGTNKPKGRSGGQGCPSEPPKPVYLPGPPMPEAELKALQARGDDGKIRWVWIHLWDETYPENLDRHTYALWRYAKMDEQAFMDKYVPMVMKRDEEKQDPEEKRQQDGLLKLIDDWLEKDRAKRCPTCGRIDGVEVPIAKESGDEQKRAASNAATDATSSPKKRTSSRPRQKLTIKSKPSANGQKELAAAPVDEKHWEVF